MDQSDIVTNILGSLKNNVSMVSDNLVIEDF